MMLANITAFNDDCRSLSPFLAGVFDAPGNTTTFDGTAPSTFREQIPAPTLHQRTQTHQATHADTPLSHYEHES